MKVYNVRLLNKSLILRLKSNAYLQIMSKAIKIRKGVDIRLVGEAAPSVENLDHSSVFAVKPPDFHGVVPKLLVKEGAQVKAGDPLFFEKTNDNIKFCSPVSGEVAEVVRGAKRRIMEIRILADKQREFRDFGTKNASTMSSEEVRAHLLEGGMWPFLNQRPFDVMADPTLTPKAIFISGFDSAPMAPDTEVIMKDKLADFQTGVDVLKKLIGDKPVHISHRPGSAVYGNIRGAELHSVSGPHPAGNVGVQIHHIDPINKGETVWTVNPQDVATIGRFFTTGKFDLQRTIAVTGAEAKDPKYYNIVVGTNLAKLIESQIKEPNTRVISGNVLTGDQIPTDGFLGYFHQQVTMIPEGDEPKFMLTEGWMSPGFNKFSLSHAYPTWLTGKKKFNLDTNANGEERAFVVTGQYEKVFPFDIYPVQLVKSIIVNDIDRMEKLGIYEVAPEDFALCEYVCTSKIDVQHIVREGLDQLKKEV